MMQEGERRRFAIGVTNHQRRVIGSALVGLSLPQHLDRRLRLRTVDSDYDVRRNPACLGNPLWCRVSDRNNVDGSVEVREHRGVACGREHIALAEASSKVLTRVPVEDDGLARPADAQRGR